MKNFLLLSALIATTLNGASVKLNAATTNPLKGHTRMVVINKLLAMSDEAGKHVDGVSQAGRCAKSIIDIVGECKQCKDASSLQEVRNKIVIEDFVEKSVQAELSGKVDMAAESPDKDTLTKEIVVLLKYRLLNGRTEFLEALHKLGATLKDTVKKSLAAEKLDEQSLLLGFFEVSSSEASTYFDVAIKSIDDLERVGKEFYTFCKHFWGALSPQLIQKRNVFLRESKK